MNFSVSSFFTATHVAPDQSRLAPSLPVVNVIKELTKELTVKK